jgi:ABC-2 type transport system permease protein
MELVSHVTMLSIILTGAALIREREHGTVEHLLVMPVTPAEIMLAKMWSMGAVVLLATSVSLNLVIRGALDVPIEGSVALFLVGASLHLFATTAIAIFMATLARTMPQFGLLIMLVLLPMQLLSGGSTPRESMPELVRDLMLVSPTTHFTELSQAILYRGAGLDVVWKAFVALVGIGAVFFFVSLARFRKTIGQLA